MNHCVPGREPPGTRGLFSGGFLSGLLLGGLGLLSLLGLFLCFRSLWGFWCSLYRFGLGLGKVAGYGSLIAVRTVDVPLYLSVLLIELHRDGVPRLDGTGDDEL